MTSIKQEILEEIKQCPQCITMTGGICGKHFNDFNLASQGTYKGKNVNLKKEILKEFEEKFATAGQDEDGNFTMVHFDLYDYKEFISQALDKIEQATRKEMITDKIAWETGYDEGYYDGEKETVKKMSVKWGVTTSPDKIRQQIIQKVIDSLPKKMGKCNEIGNDMITQYVDGYNDCLREMWGILDKLEEMK